MAASDSITQLGGWEGYEVEASWEERRGARRWYVVRLRSHPRRVHLCSGCGRRCGAVHDSEWRRVRDLPLFEASVELLLPRLRVACRACGPRLERLSWLEPYARVTVRLAHSVGRLCQWMSLRHVASFYGLSWGTVKHIDKRRLQRELGEVDLRGVRVIGMDEFAIQKGHRYATVVGEPARKRVLWVGRGRGRQDIVPFFELLGAQGCARLQAVVMDMNAAYVQEVKLRCPQAAIVYDLFHVVAKYGREVIDRVRVDEANRLRADRPARHLIKGARWLLLRNRHNIQRPKDRLRLKDILAANRKLFTAYVLKDDLKSLWRYRQYAAAQRFWQQWYGAAPCAHASSRLNALHAI